MKPFMSNPCMRPNCMRTDCENCYYYKPKAFGIRVPKWLAEWLYIIEYKIVSRKSSGKF